MFNLLGKYEKQRERKRRATVAKFLFSLRSFFFVFSYSNCNQDVL